MDALNTYDQSKRFNDQLRRVAEKSDLILTPGSLLEIELKKLNKTQQEFLMVVMIDIQNF